MIAQAVTGTPGHINPMATCMHHFLAKYPIDSLRPGDVLITNDPWKTVSAAQRHHDRDARSSKAIGWSRCSATSAMRSTSAAAASPPMRARCSRKGCSSPCSSCTTPACRSSRLLKFLRANVRTPEEVLGDVHSQVVGNDVGGARSCCRFLDEFDLAEHRAAVRRDHRPHRAGDARARSPRLPDGDYGYACEIDGFERRCASRSRCACAATSCTWTTPAHRRPSATASTSC